MKQNKFTVCERLAKSDVRTNTYETTNYKIQNFVMVQKFMSSGVVIVVIHLFSTIRSPLTIPHMVPVCFSQ